MSRLKRNIALCGVKSVSVLVKNEKQVLKTLRFILFSVHNIWLTSIQTFCLLFYSDIVLHEFVRFVCAVNHLKSYHWRLLFSGGGCQNQFQSISIGLVLHWTVRITQQWTDLWQTTLNIWGLAHWYSICGVVHVCRVGNTLNMHCVHLYFALYMTFYFDHVLVYLKQSFEYFDIWHINSIFYFWVWLKLFVQIHVLSIKHFMSCIPAAEL